jgi:nucleoside-diphosphate-sugar epimerase
MSRILVTGGFGFIGAALAKRLVSVGEEVLIFDNCSRNNSRRVRGLIPDNFYIGDVCVEDDVRNAIDNNVDEVIHLASVNGTKNFYEKPAEVLDVGLRGICNVVNACIDFGVKKLMVISSSEVYQTPPKIPTDETVPYSIPDPFNPRYSYAVQKIASEMVAIHNAKHFDNLIIVRPHNIYGPDAGEEHIIPRLMRNSDNFHAGNETRAFCYIDDAVDGLMLLREKGEHNNIYNLGTGDEIKISDLAFYISRLSGCTVHLDTALLTSVDGGTVRRCPDITKMIKLGYLPKVPLIAGLQRTLKWYQENPR